MSIKCPNCGSILPDQAGFCDQCGTPVPKIAAEETESVQDAFITCPSCGRRLDAGAAFCDGCGSPVAKPAEEAPSVQNAFIRCPNCGRQLASDMSFCDACGTPLRETSEEEEASDNMLAKDGVYRWVYELPMLKSFFLLFEVWKVLALSAVIVMLFGMLVSLLSGSGIDAVVGFVQVGLLVMAILLVLSLPAYYIVTKANNGKYTVLFEMTEEGIDHTQIKTEKAKALDELVIALGARTGSWTTAGAGLMSSGGASLYSRFSRVKRIKAYPKKHLILVNGRFVRNQVYVEDADFEFVLNYIIEHCPDAKVG